MPAQGIGLFGEFAVSRRISRTARVACRSVSGVGDEAADAKATVWDGIAESELLGVVEVFGLGAVRRVGFIAEGLMNRNWRVETERGVFAVKQIVDVSVAKTRRSLGVLEILASRGLPVCEPRPSVAGDVAGDVVADVEGRSYCVFVWAEGSHRPGVDLDLAETSALGSLLGRIHIGLAAPEAGLEPVTRRPRAKVTAVESAVAEADRFLDVIAGLDEPGPFDVAAAEALEQRKLLLDRYADSQPSDEMPRGPVGWTHGDFQPLNVLWQDGLVRAVLDWDRLGVRPYGEEVVRTAQVQFGTEDGRLDLERVAAFTAGYRSVVQVSDEDLADAT